MSNCLSALRGCITQGVHSNTESLFWKDQWFNGKAPMFLCPDAFREYMHPNGTIKDLDPLLGNAPFLENADLGP